MVTPSQIKVWLEILQCLPDRGVFLDLHKRADLGLVADFAAVEVDELGKFDIPAEFDTRSNAEKFIHEICLTNRCNATR